MPFDTDSEDVIVDRFCRGELTLEGAARALSGRRSGPVIISFAEAHPSAEVRARGEQLRTLWERVTAIDAAEQLLNRAAVAPRIDTWPAPPDSNMFCFSLEVQLRGSDAHRHYEQSMRLYVCSPAWLTERVAQYSWAWTPAPLVLAAWDPQYIRTALQALLDSAGDNTWPQFVRRMSRYMDVEG